MNVILARPALDPLWQRYLQLSPDAKLLLQLKSLIFLPATQTEFLECLKAIEARTDGGKAWSAQLAQAVLDELSAQGLLVARHEHRPK